MYFCDQVEFIFQAGNALFHISKPSLKSSVLTMFPLIHLDSDEDHTAITASKSIIMVMQHAQYGRNK